MTDQPILLTAYDAKRCPRRVHNDWDPTIPQAPWEPPPTLRVRLDAGIAFENEVVRRLVEVWGERCLDLNPVEGAKQRIAATVEAMDAGVEVILGGQLPHDISGGRSGKPDLLLRVSPLSASPAYVPGDVKAHHVLTRAATRTFTYSLSDRPAERLVGHGWSSRSGHLLADCLQLAHYTRMLQTAGYAPAGLSAFGFIIGTDELPDISGGPVLVWHDLSAPMFTTYSRSRGTATRSALERYDHEHGFRLKVARTAAARTGAPSDPDPIVVPIFQSECETCPWFDYCLGQLGESAASVAITSGRLDLREWRALHDLGIRKTAELARLDIDTDPTLDRYWPEVTHHTDARTRLQTAIRRARMITEGVELERITGGALKVPAAEVEIDLDSEWDPDNRVYLWGTLIRIKQGEATYRPFVSWGPLDDDAEQALAMELAVWLRTQIDNAEQQGMSVAVFHYAAVERTHLRRILGESVEDVLTRFVDLLPFMREHFFGAHGLGLKNVAPAVGFTWSDEEPGGLQSQVWLNDARSGPDDTTRDAARRRLLRYNHDDVLATAALRDGLRAIGNGPSVGRQPAADPA
jgi:predicted RecB family nuclease